MAEPSDEALAHLFGEAEAVFDRQMTILERLDEKAARIVRFNTLILGLLIAATSLASGQTRIDEAMPAWVSIGFAAALALLVFSTFAAILAHRAQKLRIGLRVERIVEASQRDVDDRDVLGEAIRSYGRCVTENSQAKDRTVRRLEWASMSLLASVAVLSVSATGLLVGGFP